MVQYNLIYEKYPIAQNKWIPFVVIVFLFSLSVFWGHDKHSTLIAGLIASLSVGISVFLWQLANSTQKLIPKEVLKNQKIFTKEVTDQAKQEFISVVSHELRSPLTAIHASIGLLMKSADQPTGAKELLSVAHRNSERLTRIINDLLEIDHIERGTVKLEIRKFSILKLIDDTIQSIYPIAHKAKISIIKEGNFTDLNIKSDSNRISEVLINLLTNAIKFSPSNSVVYISMDQINNYIRVSVRDKGKGIPDKFKPHVFDKFTQADSSNRRTGGVGLGLYICKGLLETLNGRIDFVSQENKGSTFYFELPIGKDDYA